MSPRKARAKEVERTPTTNNQGRNKGGRLERLTLLNYENDFIHRNFVQFGKQLSRYKAILPSIVLSQQCCEVIFISLRAVSP